MIPGVMGNDSTSVDSRLNVFLGFHNHRLHWFSSVFISLNQPGPVLGPSVRNFEGVYWSRSDERPKGSPPLHCKPKRMAPDYAASGALKETTAQAQFISQCRGQVEEINYRGANFAVDVSVSRGLGGIQSPPP